jgi:serine/threonine-protein kinase RsbT
LESKSIALKSERDISNARAQVRVIAAALGFRLIDQTRLATVASELSRNVIKYGGGGQLIAQPTHESDGRRGLRIRDLAAAMRDGFSTGGGLGQGLPGSKRLVHEFAIESSPERGTRVTVVRWRE